MSNPRATQTGARTRHLQRGRSWGGGRGQSTFWDVLGVLKSSEDEHTVEVQQILGASGSVAVVSEAVVLLTVWAVWVPKEQAVEVLDTVLVAEALARKRRASLVVLGVLR